MPPTPTQRYIPGYPPLPAPPDVIGTQGVSVPPGTADPIMVPQSYAPLPPPSYGPIDVVGTQGVSVPPGTADPVSHLQPFQGYPPVPPPTTANPANPTQEWYVPPGGPAGGTRIYEPPPRYEPVPLQPFSSGAPQHMALQWKLQGGSF